MPDLPEEAVQAADKASLVDRAYNVGIAVLEEYQTTPHDDLRLNAARASAKVASALLTAGLLRSEEEIRADERRKTTEEIAAQLRRVAAGRREYAQDAPEDMAKTLTLEAAWCESAANVAEGNVWTLTGLLPSWRWTDEETKAVCETGERE